ncbi:MAG: protein YgfX [Gammaproteobacteria bacterium]
MTAGFTGPIRLQPTGSALLGTGIAFSHTGALVIVALLPWPAWARVSVAMLLCGSLVWSLAWHVLHRGDAVTEAILQGDGSWTVRAGPAEPVSATLANDSVVTPYLTVLLFKLADGRRRSLLVLPDNIEPETFRRLRVRLRFPLSGTAS